MSVNRSKIKLGLYFLLYLYSLNIYGNDTYTEVNDSIVPIKIDKIIDENYPKSQLKSSVLSIITKSCKCKIDIKDIDSVNYWGTLNVYHLNPVSIFKIKYSYELPSVWHYSAVLIIDNVNHNAYLLDLDVVEPVKVQNNVDTFYFAGIYTNRYLIGTFKIFDFKNGNLYDIYDSNEPVSNYSLDCISYENEFLKFQNVDLNSDGYLDIKFSGVRNYYCNGYEQYGREERKPIKKDKISITFIYNNIKKSWEESSKAE